MEQCVGVKKDGVRCSVMVVAHGHNIRCGVHTKTLNKVGPNQIRRDEMKYTHDKNLRDIYKRHATILRDLPAGADMERAYRAREAENREEEIRHQAARHALELSIDRETEANGGRNADAEYIERGREAARQRRAALQERWRIRNDQWQQRHQAEVQNQVIANIQAARQRVAGAVQQGELGVLANDRQNVHTAMVVAKVKETVDKILLIPVPLDYRTDTLKTTGEIILECKLSRGAAWQMMAKYCADEDIYDMGVGIYGRVLNSVWQYIKASPDADDLKKILASEMRDNIGMCAQGNLSRLCNILSGYLDGITADVKSRNEILGELLAPLMELDFHERLRRALEILTEQNVPEEERDVWLEPLNEVD